MYVCIYSDGSIGKVDDKVQNVTKVSLADYYCVCVCPDCVRCLCSVFTIVLLSTFMMVKLLLLHCTTYSDHALWSAQFPRRGTPDLEHVTTSSQEQ